MLVTSKLLQVIQETIDAGRIKMTDEEAFLLYREKVGPFMSEHNREPRLNSRDPLEHRMAEAIIYNLCCNLQRECVCISDTLCNFSQDLKP